MWISLRSSRQSVYEHIERLTAEGFRSSHETKTETEIEAEIH